ncbi:alternate-type signal peptide domain-containing protein [Agromyces atrinae]|uniref:alternate-type signal peptide domain-containing protein n=1 Tax=Agromyces atrinae TaxID=592376 RepID=UPI001F58275A|nr:alternate-type signal peptide domain-containing protein [Agromyces atrinae]MCI2956788.1 alternate-type signal peptide domain-containing protein [Agromyces atrinae]
MTRTFTTIVVSGAMLIVGLLSGGVAWALWNDDDPVSTAVIATGDIDLALDATSTWWDLSDDVAGSPLEVDSDFLTVPGDTIAFEQPFSVATTGDNMRAEIDADVPSLTDVAGTLSSDIDVTYTLLDADGDVVGTIDDITAGTPSTFELTGADDGSAAYTLWIVFEWQPGSADRIRVTDIAHLDAVEIDLRQVRP